MSPIEEPLQPADEGRYQDRVDEIQKKGGHQRHDQKSSGGRPVLLRHSLHVRHRGGSGAE